MIALHLHPKKQGRPTKYKFIRNSPLGQQYRNRSTANSERKQLILSSQSLQHQVCHPYLVEERRGAQQFCSSPKLDNHPTPPYDLPAPDVLGLAMPGLFSNYSCAVTRGSLAANEYILLVHIMEKKGGFSSEVGSEDKDFPALFLRPCINSRDITAQKRGTRPKLLSPDRNSASVSSAVLEITGMNEEN
ncbi:hypothetical protein Anapl_03870 [Anas platyrhynchos]|uniref:Uncharacterized protein n=1 Tax=Anas platyrhynchos TaxID=8839 RepID=R0KS06_ANAPL|nr:hypothetical protein Anapl_03870 [Anas platyrhynchos]